MEMPCSLQNFEICATHLSSSFPNYQIMDIDRQLGQEMVEVREQNENPQNKRRKRLSKVWEDFTMSTDGLGKAVCNHCKKEFDGSSKKGTTHLKNHSERCLRKRNNGGGDADGVVTKEESVIDLIKRSFHEEGDPTDDYDPIVLNSRKGDVLQVYEEEKEKLRRFLNNLSCRFSLTIEKVYCDKYALLVNYIDDSWEMKTKIISFLKVDKDEILREKIEVACLEWKTHSNIFSNDWVYKQVSLPFVALRFNSSDFHEFYDAFEASHTIQRIKGCHKYINESLSTVEMFDSAIDNAKSIMGNKVPSGRGPNWSCFLDFSEIQITVGFKEAFCKLEQMDPDFKSINLTKEQWDEATLICEQLQALYDIAQTFTDRNPTTTIAYFSMFCDIYVKLLRLQRSERAFSVGKEASTVLIEKFVEDYWNKSKMTLAIAVILDPRFKMDIVEKWYKEIYGSEADGELENIKGSLKKVFNEYAKARSESGDVTSSTSYKMLDAMGRPCTSSDQVVDDLSKSELDCYLSEPTLPRIEKFNILKWWHANTLIFPTLARIARDFLAIPICTSHSELDSFLENFYEVLHFDRQLDDDIKEALLTILPVLDVKPEK